MIQKTLEDYFKQNGSNKSLNSYKQKNSIYVPKKLGAEHQLSTLLSLANLPSGFAILEDFIDEQQEKDLLNWLDSGSWHQSKNRLVQNFGYDYREKPAKIKHSIPSKLQDLIQKIQSSQLYLSLKVNQQEDFEIDQVLATSYASGEGIAPHIDNVQSFRDVIYGLSLNSHTVLRFTSRDWLQNQEVLLKPRSLYRLSGASRYEWMHSIPARKSDLVGGQKLARQRRVSLTFRRSYN